MPWSEVSIMDSRREFVFLARQEGANKSALCRGFGISRKTGHKWLNRVQSGAGVEDRPRRPRSSPSRTLAAMEAAVVEQRRLHPSWGARKTNSRRLSIIDTSDHGIAELLSCKSSGQMCHPCHRTPVTYLSSLYTGRGLG